MVMDPQAIANLFATSLSVDPNVRKAGEIEIRKIGNQEGVLSCLMQIIGNDGVDPAVRQACSVFLKNRVVRAWHVDSTTARVDATPIPQSDRTFIKSHILALLVAAATRPLRVQLTSSLKTIITYDFPSEWPTLLDEILALLNSGDQRSIYGGCFALLELVKSMRFRIENNYMPRIAEKSFPTLVELGTNIVNNMTPDNADCLHIILKTYKASTQTSLSPHQQGSQSIMAWGRLLFAVVNVQLPTGATLPGTPEDWEQSEWWKAKKWAFNTLNRLFERYGNPSQLPESMKKEVSAFADHFVKSFAPEIFKMYLQQIELYVSKQIWLSKKVLSAILRYFSACVKPKSTWAILKPHADNLVSNVVFPALIFDDERVELWRSDPVEFTRRTLEMDDLVAPSAAGLSFLLQLAQSRPKSTFMGALAFINNVLSTPTATPNQKFGALSMISALGGVIMGTKSLKDDMEGFVTKFVLPEFQSPEGFMRQIACEVIGTLERFDMQWKTPGTLEAVYRAVAHAVEDSQLPVRVSAVLALMHMLDHEEVRQGLSPHVVQIMQVLFTLSDETDMDVISEAMESFIDTFKSELVPASVQIVERLCQNYQRLIQEHIASQAGTSGADDASVTSKTLEDDKTMAMMGLAKTIEAVVDSLESVEPTPMGIVTQVQELVIHIINVTLGEQVIDLFDAMFSLVDIFTFTLRKITPAMWPVFESMYKLFKSIAIDYLDDMLPSLDNFIDFGKDVFANRPDYRNMIIDFYTTALTSTSLSGDQDRVSGCKLGEAILLHLRGQVDDALPSIISTAATIFAKPAKTQALKLASLNLLINILLYNPALSLQIMETPQHAGLARVLLDEWFVALKSPNGKALPRAHDKRLSVITLSALMEIDPSHVPPSLKDGWPGLLGGALDVFVTLGEAISRREELLVLSDANIDEDEDDEEIAGDRSLVDNDDEDVWDEDEEYLQMLAAEGARLRGKREARHADEDDEDAEDGESDDESIEEEINVETPLDSVNPWIRFKAALTHLQMSNPAGYQAATTALNPEQQARLMEVMAAAQKAEEDTATQGSA